MRNLKKDSMAPTKVEKGAVMKSIRIILIIPLITLFIVTTLCVQGKVLGREKLFKMGRDKTAADNIETDIPYLGDKDPRHRLDIYLPPRSNDPSPVLIHIHGGGWKIGDKKLMKDTGVFYASKGILFITPNYRLSPAFMHPAHAGDCAAAVAWVFDHAEELGGDKKRIFLSGHSAGAHLAALLGTNRSFLGKYKIKPDDLAGVIPVDTASFDLLSETNEMAVKRFIRQAFGENKNVLKQASPFYNVTEQSSYPGFLILNTTGRENAVRAGEDFAGRLKDAGCDVLFIPVKNHTHKEMAEGMHDASDPVSKAILRFITGCIKKYSLTPAYDFYIMFEH